uniref:Uncharacterized protein LOC100187420 n=1 Tax=Phallusia mammillata TaxID=59560 RepID=A0A6F9DIP0_9ASCI|nr:uncharacterized protein LOC100187420 [Phallusia mammillata]
MKGVFVAGIFALLLCLLACDASVLRDNEETEKTQDAMDVLERFKRSWLRKPGAGRNYRRRCLIWHRHACNRLIKKCYTTVLSKRSISSEDTEGNIKINMQPISDNVREKRSSRRRVLLYRPTCGDCSHRCW